LQRRGFLSDDGAQEGHFHRISSCSSQPFIGIQIVWLIFLYSRYFSFRKGGLNHRDNISGDLVLQLKQAGHGAVISLRPKMGAGYGIDQLT
jgi:hypothetical protein